MVSPTCFFMNLMICFVLLCTYVRISSTQPLLNSDDDEDQAQVYEPFLNNLIIKSGRFPPHNPESLYDYHEEQQPQLFHQNKQYHPDNLQLAKRIIMLPRVGRRSIRSSSRKQTKNTKNSTQ